MGQNQMRRETKDGHQTGLRSGDVGGGPLYMMADHVGPLVHLTLIHIT